VAIYSNIDQEEVITALILSFEMNLVAYNCNLLVKLLVRAL